MRFTCLLTGEKSMIVQLFLFLKMQVDTLPLIFQATMITDSYFGIEVVFIPSCFMLMPLQSIHR